ncbi:MAG: hypothetical protein OXU64_02490 [Gemmatimonadota bacterium]|nr:hypothetical protein [Gemmatimonadota bacterium]
MGRKALVGFGFVATGILTGAVWAGFGDLLPATRPWLPVVIAALVVAGVACFLFPRPESHASVLARASQDVVVALKGHRDQLERIAALPERLGTPLEHIGEQMGELAHRLDRHDTRMERLAMELMEAGQHRGTGQAVPESPSETGEEPTPRPDFGKELMEAWKRYRDDGDGHFNAEGFKAALANTGIDADVRGLDGQPGQAVLMICDPWANDRSFFVVPDFSKSPRSAERWFEDESGGALGGRTEELRKLGRGRWSESGPEMVEKGSVA